MGINGEDKLPACKRFRLEWFRLVEKTGVETRYSQYVRTETRVQTRGLDLGMEQKATISLL